MFKSLQVLLILAIFVVGSSSAKIYKWVDKDGNVHYTDQKPESQKAEVVNMDNLKPLGKFKTSELNSNQNTSQDQYHSQNQFKNENKNNNQNRTRKVKKFVPRFTSAHSKGVKSTTQKKLVMYSASWCGYCKKARNYFVTNGIKFVERDIEKSTSANRSYKKLGGKGLPLIVYGDKTMQGFSIQNFKNFYDQ